MDRIILTTKSELSELIGDVVERRLIKLMEIKDFQEEKMSQHKTAQFIGCSIPTLKKLVNQGRLVEHSLGKRKYFLKSEVIEGMKK